MVSATSAARLSARAELLRAFVAAWQSGRGRPVDRAVLAQSGAVSEVFLAPVAALAEELAGDGRRLLTALQGKQIKGFKRAKAAELESYLLAEGDIDTRPVGDEAAVRGQVYQALAEQLARRELSLAEAAALVGRLWRASEATLL